MDEVNAAEINLVDQVREELIRIDELEVNQHGASFESLHQKLQEALSSIDGL